MARNDVILVDGIVDTRLQAKNPSSDRSEVFELFVFEEALKCYDLSREELESGWTDGGHDGGIDGFFVFVNGHLIDDIDSFHWPKTNAAIDVWLFTCKHHDTFQQAPLEALLASLVEVLDFQLDDQELLGKYSEEIVAARSLLAGVYRRLSIDRPTLHFHLVYGSRGDTNLLGQSVEARANQLRSRVADLFSSCTVDFLFLGASELVEAHRKSKTFSLSLPFVEQLSTGKQSHVLLVRLADYWRFVSDDEGMLRRYLFDSNVRDYLGANKVNQDIEWSLKDETAPDFWWLNNGVTILATNATMPGKIIQLQNIQIVNGLQTTETLHRYFSSYPLTDDDRVLLVKIIVSSDTLVRDRIIRATNNQTSVELASLHATDKIQRDIEQILEKHNWFYERRKNYYQNAGKPSQRIIAPIYLASAVVAILLKNPAQATKLKTNFMRHQSAYDGVFSDSYPISVWPVLAGIYRRVESVLVQVSTKKKVADRFVVSWRPLVSLLVAAKMLKTFTYSVTDVATLVPEDIRDEDVEAAWRTIASVTGSDNQRMRFHASVVLACCNAFASKYDLGQTIEIGKRSIQRTPDEKNKKKPLSREFLDFVDGLLPEQPWKPGIHLQIAEKVASTPKQVSQAIQELIAMGKRFDQIDGVVYDSAGVAIARDPDRVSLSVDEINLLRSRNPE